jgi:hypothetical protein
MHETSLVRSGMYVTNGIICSLGDAGQSPHIFLMTCRLQLLEGEQSFEGRNTRVRFTAVFHILFMPETCTT